MKRIGRVETQSGTETLGTVCRKEDHMGKERGQEHTSKPGIPDMEDSHGEDESS